MINSMTGFGRCSKVVNGRLITVEIRSVNHRYFEFNSRIQRNLVFMEEKVKAIVSQSISRGKLDVSIYVQALEVSDTVVRPNTLLAASYIKAFEQICDELDIINDITATTFTRIPEIFVIERAQNDEEALLSDVVGILKPALGELCKMRAVEGEKLLRDIEARLLAIDEIARKIEKGDALRKQEYYDKLYSRLKNLLSDNNIEESRLVTEAAIFADKTSVTEETVRISSHIKQFNDIMRGDEPAGRKLDFLTQELNREVNTIGSKISDSDVTMLVVDMKSQIEKIREQIQNVE